jgi:hypothetical protein
MRDLTLILDMSGSMKVSQYFTTGQTGGLKKP